MTDAIENWREATEQVADAFVEKYFPEAVREMDANWVDNEIGGVFVVDDMHFDVDRMIEALDLNATFDQLYDYYHKAIKYPERSKKYVNFKNYVKYGWKEEV